MRTKTVGLSGGKCLEKPANALKGKPPDGVISDRRQVKKLKRQVKKHELNFTKESGIILTKNDVNTAKTGGIPGKIFDFGWEKPPVFLRCFDGTGWGNGVRI